jgi:DNA-binding NtrC family response regulator/tetratricopeptide (TPR) repeat protein/Mrp family chromosome partitioning ATPase
MNNQTASKPTVHTTNQERLKLPCFGREQEISRLLESFKRARQGDSLFILVTGKPGIGKSTFMASAQHSLRDQGALVLEGCCRPGLPSYRPLLDVARGALSHLSGAGADSELLERGQGLIDVLDNRSIATVSGSQSASVDMRGRESDRISLFDRMAELLRSVSEIRPTVVMLHDLDFADPSTLQLFGYLGRVLVGTPELSEARYRGLLMANARDAGVLDLNSGWRGEISALQLDLDGLSAAGVRAFLSSEEVVSRVLESTGGEPRLLDVLTQQSTVKTVEETSPLSGLGPSELRVLEVLAVFGRPLGPETLRLLCDLPNGRLAQTIVELSQRRQILEKVVVDGELRIGFARVGDQGEVIDGLSETDRRGLHTQIGHYLEAQGEAELESCAAHLLRGHCGEHSARLALEAGQRLEIAFCFERAAELYERALSQAEDATLTRDLTARLCSVYEVTGELDQALHYTELAREQDPADPEVSLRIAHLHLIRGDFAAARAELGALRQILPEQAGVDTRLRARVLADSAWAQYMAGDPDSAVATATSGLSLVALQDSDAEELATVQMSLRNTLGKIDLESGRYEQCREHFLDNLSWAQTAGLPSEEVRALVQLGQTSLQTGDYDRAAEWYQQARELAEAIGDQRFLGACLQHLGVLAERRRDYRQALDLYQRAVAAWKKVGHRSYLAWVGLDLGKLYLRLGDLPRATAMADLADRMADSEPPLATRINLELLRGRIALSECRYKEATERFIRARDLASGAGQSERALRSLLDLVTLQLTQERFEEARSLLAREVGLPEQRSLRLKALLLWARAESRTGEASAARNHLGEALELSEALQDPESAWQVRFLLSRVASEQGRHAEAGRLLREAATGERRVRATVPGEFLETLADQPLRVELRKAQMGEVKAPPKAAPKRQRSGSPEAATPQGFDHIVGRHPRMQQVFSQIEKVAVTDALVLIRGESGTGKELIAEAIHQRSRRLDKPLVKVNCGALVESLLLSELFGHERGAFTGAMQRKKGRFEIANGGTIFLDEIGDVSPKTQVALLRVLQNHEFERVGGTTSISVDVRIICATNKNLEEMVAQGTFREDLYYRLKGLLLELPPLRHRREDISLLTEHFLERIGRERGSCAKELSVAAEQLLRGHEWPGNVRELENVLRSVSLFADGDLIDVNDFGDYPELGVAERPTASEASSASPYGQIRAQGLSLREFKKHIEAECIVEALGEVGGNITKAAKLLGMKRPRLSQLIKEHELSVR